VRGKRHLLLKLFKAAFASFQNYFTLVLLLLHQSIVQEKLYAYCGHKGAGTAIKVDTMRFLKAKQTLTFM
jgi:hypothetical protein